MKKILSLLLCAALLLGLTACGGSSKATVAIREEAAAEAPAMMADNAASLKGAGSSPTALPEGRKWIVTIDMNVETDDLDTLTDNLNQKINSLGGYVEDQSIHNGSNFSSRRYRSANLTVRIPDEKADTFTGEVAGMANVVSQNLRREDITLKYVATSSRVTALETEEARLLELMAMAKNMEDLLLIEKRLTEVRTELEQVTSQLRLYDNLIDFGTIHLNLQQVTKFTDTTQEPTVWQRIGSGFLESLEGIGDFFVEIFVWIVVASPYLAILAVGVIVIVLLVKKASRKHKKASNDPQ